MITFNENSILSSKPLFLCMCVEIQTETRKFLPLTNFREKISFLVVLLIFFYLFFLLTYSILRFARLLKIS